MLRMRSLLLLAPLAWLAAGISVDELESFFASASGLGMGYADAYALAQREAPTATQCGVTITTLKDLRRVLYDLKGIDMGVKDIRANLLPLAYAHVEPATLTALWSGLYGSGSLGLPIATAQARVVELALQGAVASELRPLFSKLYGYRGVNLPLKDAQAEALQLALAGADADSLLAAFQQSRRQGRSAAAALRDAEQAAVRRDTDGLSRRYAKDATVYSAAEFQSHYGATWLSEWLTAPQEKRLARDSKAYSAAEFREYFGSSWHSEFVSGTVATQKRLANDGRAYTMQEFQQHYGDSWQTRWKDAPEVPCVECRPHSEAAAAADLVV